MIDNIFTVFVYGYVGGLALGLVITSVARSLVWIARNIFSI